MILVAASLPWALLFATEAVASCAYGTHLHPRAEGTVEVNTFGYSALNVGIHHGLAVYYLTVPRLVPS